jgi:hypothetical protein
MGLIQDAIAEARDRSVATSDLLRTCQVVAFRLKHHALKEWVNFELSGYSDDAELPSYRVLAGVRLKATIVNPARWYRGIDVPLGSIPPAYHESAQRVHLRAPVAELEGLVRNASSTLRTQPVPPDVFTQLEIMEMSTTLELWGELSAHAVVGLLDQIRTRALTLLLELEAANPDAGESTDGSPPVATETLDRIVQTVIYTGSIMVAPAAQIAIQQVVIRPGDLDTLVAWARQTGVPEATIRQLPDAISADGQTIGAKTRKWMQRAAAAATSAGRDVAVGVIEAAVRRYLGLP